jgi:hypothetical protein
VQFYAFSGVLCHCRKAIASVSATATLEGAAFLFGFRFFGWHFKRFPLLVLVLALGLWVAGLLGAARLWCFQTR